MTVDCSVAKLCIVWQYKTDTAGKNKLSYARSCLAGYISGLASSPVSGSSWEPDNGLVLPSSVYTYLSLRIFKHKPLSTCEN